MGMPRNGCSTRRSLSPVIMQEAFAEMANSRNLLSVGSRQSVMVIPGVNTLELISILFIIDHRSLSFWKYLSNFCLNNTSINSSIVWSDKAITPKSIALPKALRLVEFVIRAALIRLLVSKTKRSLIFSQYVLKNILCKASFLHRFTDFIKELLKFFFRINHQFFCHPKIYLLRYLISKFFRRRSPFFCGSIINFNNYSFHFINYKCNSNLQKLGLQYFNYA